MLYARMATAMIAPKHVQPQEQHSNGHSHNQGHANVDELLALALVPMLLVLLETTGSRSYRDKV